MAPMPRKEIVVVSGAGSNASALGVILAPKQLMSAAKALFYTYYQRISATWTIWNQDFKLRVRVVSG